MARLVLLRHGESQWNLGYRLVDVHSLLKDEEAKQPVKSSVGLA